MDTSFRLISETDYHNLNSKLDRLLAFIEEKGLQTAQPLGKWMTEKEAQELTGKKVTTLWKMRNKGLLEFTKINNKVFYNRESIMALMEQNKRPAYRLP